MRLDFRSNWVLGFKAYHSAYKCLRTFIAALFPAVGFEEQFRADSQAGKDRPQRRLLIANLNAICFRLRDAAKMSRAKL